MALGGLGNGRQDHEARTAAAASVTFPWCRPSDLARDGQPETRLLLASTTRRLEALAVGLGFYYVAHGWRVRLTVRFQRALSAPEPLPGE